MEQDANYHSLMGMLKTRGMESVTEQDMQTVRKEVLEHIGMQKTANLVKE